MFLTGRFVALPGLRESRRLPVRSRTAVMLLAGESWVRWERKTDKSGRDE